jgi:ferrochelatase
MPFLENVLRGKNVPRERMLEVAEHYHHFGGVSPINQQCRNLIDALDRELAQHQIDLPIYWGNRNWHPMLSATVQKMRDEGVKNVIAFFTSLYSSYSGCRQYREDLYAACDQSGISFQTIDKLRMPYNHPLLVEIMSDSLSNELKYTSNSDDTLVLFCAHSIPTAMADRCAYQDQLQETARLTAGLAKHQRWELVYQSRSGPANQPWLEPDICDRIEQLKDQHELSSVIVHPIGFISDHMEVLYDLDHEAKDLCESLGIEFRRAATCGTDPRFAQLIRELVEERCDPGMTRAAVGKFPANHDVCPANCCLGGRVDVPSKPALAQRD